MSSVTDGVVPSNSDAGEQQQKFRMGKWTKEEEVYTQCLIEEFVDGHLSLPERTSLRQFLANMLGCHPKRVSKKFEGSNYAKGRKFYRKSSVKLAPSKAARRQDKLQALEHEYKDRLREMNTPKEFLGADLTLKLFDTTEAPEGSGRGCGTKAAATASCVASAASPISNVASGKHHTPSLQLPHQQHASTASTLDSGENNKNGLLLSLLGGNDNAGLLGNNHVLTELQARLRASDLMSLHHRLDAHRTSTQQQSGVGALDAANLAFLLQNGLSSGHTDNGMTYPNYQATATHGLDSNPSIASLIAYHTGSVSSPVSHGTNDSSTLSLVQRLLRQSHQQQGFGQAQNIPPLRFASSMPQQQAQDNRNTTDLPALLASSLMANNRDFSDLLLQHQANQRQTSSS